MWGFGSDCVRVSTKGGGGSNNLCKRSCACVYARKEGEQADIHTRTNQPTSKPTNQQTNTLTLVPFRRHQGALAPRVQRLYLQGVGVLGELEHVAGHVPGQGLRGWVVKWVGGWLVCKGDEWGTGRAVSQPSPK